MEIYKVQDYLYNGHNWRMMYIKAENARKAREVFVNTTDSRFHRLRVYHVKYFDTATIPESWQSEERGQGNWIPLNFYHNTIDDLNQSTFTPFKSRKEKIRGIFKK